MAGSWHGGAAAVVALGFDVDAETPVLAQGGRYAAHASTMSHQAYGPDVGLPRILELLDDLEVPATFFVPGWVAERRPGLAASIVERGHEVAHHSYSHRPPTSMSPEEERADFERALEVFAGQGIEITGHRAALWEASWTTAELVAEHGLRYDSSLMGDDRPYRVPTAAVKKGPSTKGEAADGVAFTGRSFLITQKTAEDEEVPFRVAVVRVDDRVAYLLANPSAEFDFSADQWKAIMTRTAQRVSQLP